MKRPLTEGKTRNAKKPVDGDRLVPITPPPAGKQAPAGNFMTDAKASQLTEQGFKLEGYIMRDERGNCALVHTGRVVQITNDELDELLNTFSTFSDEEEG